MDEHDDRDALYFRNSRHWEEGYWVGFDEGLRKGLMGAPTEPSQELKDVSNLDKVLHAIEYNIETNNRREAIKQLRQFVSYVRNRVPLPITEAQANARRSIVV